MSIFKMALVAALALAPCTSVLAAQVHPAAQPTVLLKVMTFNLRYASEATPNSWAERRPVTKACLQQEAPDVIGTQEGVYAQLQDIAADNPDYAWIGLGREGGSHSEFMAVFYRTSRLEPLEYDHFWLSDTPEVMASKSWGNNIKRMVTWVRFRDRQTGQQFYFWNTHLDHQSQAAREKSAELILQRVKALKLPLPVILTGDFNAEARRNRTYDILTAQEAFEDTWFSTAKKPGQDFATFHGYNPPIPAGPHIDWILTRGRVSASETYVVTFQQNGQYPSDHFPLVATLALPMGVSSPT